MAKKMTMADIASLSGVGKSTVSRYFNGGYVKDETRAKIQKVIEEYNYTPNAFARLNAKQSNVIGVVVPTLNSKITSRVITSIDRYLREKGYTTLIQNSDHNIDQELQNIQRLIQLNVDGILISSIAITKDHKELLKKAEEVLAAIPQVNILGHPKQRAGCISIQIDGVHPYDFASMIDKYGVAVRTGSMCAQPIVNKMGLDTVIRISPAFYNTMEEMEKLGEYTEKVIAFFERIKR